VDESELLNVKDLAQIRKRGGEETKTNIIADEEKEPPYAPTTAPMASGTSNGAYTSYSAQHNNIHRPHQIAFPEEEGGLITQERPSGTSMVCIFHLPYSITKFSDLTKFFSQQQMMSVTMMKICMRP
jgi:hypothetical protein